MYTDEIKTRLTNERNALKGAIEKHEKEAKKETNQRKLGQLKTKCSELEHLWSLKDSELKQEKAEKADKAMFRAEIEKKTKDWDKTYPKKTTEMLKAGWQDSQNPQATTAIVATNSKAS